MTGSAGRDPAGPGAGLSAEQFAEASTAEIAAGGLPLGAQWRIASAREAARQGRATFTSGLSVEEFAALRSVGFTPVSQVMGSAVYNIGWSTTGCGYWGARGNLGALASYGGPVGYGMAAAPVVDVPSTRQILQEARQRAMHRLEQECTGLGGDGVVGVRVTMESFYGNGLEFMVTGTAVRALGDVRPSRPFTSDLSGQDFAKLVRAGWLPVSLVMGLGVALRHDDWQMRSQQASWTNQELVGPTALVHAVRAAARESLAVDVRRHGGTTAVLKDMVLNVAEVTCRSMGDEARDHFADAFLFGTAVVALPDRDTDPATRARPLPVLRLDARRAAPRRT